MDDTVESRNGLRIRLTAERWAHITEEHCELAGMREEVLQAVSEPERIVAGNQGELIAVREAEPGKFLPFYPGESSPWTGGSNCGHYSR